VVSVISFFYPESYTASVLYSFLLLTFVEVFWGSSGYSVASSTWFLGLSAAADPHRTGDVAASAN
jgi:hypothetical protein